ncbi:MAG: MFS transporter, partial [Lachnospiraceae bacterium]|nr:MFS transporter [Lachnospiraceae bacterium]
LLRKFMNSLKIFYVCLGMAVAGYIVLLTLAFTNMSNVLLLFIPGFFIFAANGMLTVIVTVFLANTVDYGQLKNGRRDESVIFSMQTFVVKLASGFAAFVASLCLQIFSLSSEASTEAEMTVDLSASVAASSKVGLRMTMTLIPIAGLIFAFFWFRRKYILTDEKLEEIENKLKATK